MKLSVAQWIAAGFVACAFLSAGAACAESRLDFDRWMQKLERRSLSVQRHLKRQAADAAIADAEEMQALYRSIAAFYLQRGRSQEEIKLSTEGSELSSRVADAAAAGDFAAALDAAITLAKACRSCHKHYKPLE